MSLPEWNEEACRRYADSLRPLVRFDHRRWAERIAGELVGLPPKATIVDIASGPAFLLVELGRRLSDATLVAQDQAEPMLAIARQEAAAAGLSIRTVCCPAEKLALEDEVADVVTCKQLLHEANDVKGVLGETARILRPGGRLFLIDFDADGSRLAALAVRGLILATGGLKMARGFWRSYRAGLPGARVRQQVLDAGLETAEYQLSGFNYFIVGRKGGAS